MTAKFSYNGRKPLKIHLVGDSPLVPGRLDSKEGKVHTLNK